MAGVSSALLLPWLWIIETLASDKEIETSLIYDLMEIAPRLPNDVGKNMKEMVALRCLEGLLGPSNGNRNEVSVEVDCNVRFDPSESCENVLESISGKAPSHMTMAQGELLKLDAHSFIIQKRAAMPKCPLLQLKDEILDGTHQYAVTMKSISGLSSAIECQTIPSNSGEHNALAQRIHESSTCPQNLIPQILENGNKQLEKVSLKGNSLPCNNDSFEMSTEKVAEDVPESQCVVKAKKRKHLDYSAITCENGLCKNLAVNEIENHSMYLVEPQTSSGTPSKGNPHEISRSGGTFTHGFQLGALNNASNDDGTKKFLTDECKDDMDDCFQTEKLRDGDGYDNGRIDIFMMKNQFVSSQFTSHDSSAVADCTEQNLCVKCHEEGQLLVCSAYGCHLAFHEYCLGSLARFDDRENFCCPFCTYSIVISEYLEAKEKATLARKRLASFMDSAFEPQLNGITHILHAKEYNPIQSGNVDIVEVVQNGHLREMEDNQVDCTGNHVNKFDNIHVQQCTHDKQLSESLASRDKVNLSCRREANVNRHTCHVSSNEQEEEDMVAKGCPDVRGTEGEEGQVPADHICDNGKAPSENREAIHMNRRCTEGRTKQKEEFDNHVTAFNKRRRKEIKYTYPAIPQLRRIRLPFTAEEEEMIKVGVSTFSKGNEKTIPWKAILEFGANVFQKGRNTIDLKDKWRNMNRGSPSS